MALPIVGAIFKIVSLKFIKGAIWGIGRYFHKITRHRPVDENGNYLTGWARLKHNLCNRAGRKENVIFLILMFGNLFFGFQELCLWCWGMTAKRCYPHFRTGIPAALIDPNNLCDELQNESWPKIFAHIFRWLAIASLVYWPELSDPKLRLYALPDKRWLEVAYKRHIYWVRIDSAREFDYAGLHFVIESNGRVSATSHCGEKVIFNPNALCAISGPTP